MRYLSILLMISFTFFLGCSDSGVSLGTAPEGLTFTDANGNPIGEISPGDTVQVRDDDGNVIVAFTVESEVDLSGLLAGQDTTTSFAHFEDTTGLSGDITLFIPCSADSDLVLVTPGAQSTSEIDTEGNAQGTVELTVDNPGPVSGYTFSNASTRSGTEPCEVTADVSNFGTGGVADQYYDVIASLSNGPDKDGAIDSWYLVESNNAPVLRVAFYEDGTGQVWAYGVDLANILENSVDDTTWTAQGKDSVLITFTSGSNEGRVILLDGLLTTNKDGLADNDRITPGPAIDVENGSYQATSSNIELQFENQTVQAIFDEAT